MSGHGENDFILAHSQGYIFTKEYCSFLAVILTASLDGERRKGRRILSRVRMNEELRIAEEGSEKPLRMQVFKAVLGNFGGLIHNSFPFLDDAELNLVMNSRAQWWTRWIKEPRQLFMQRVQGLDSGI